MNYEKLSKEKGSQLVAGTIKIIKNITTKEMFIEGMEGL